MIGKFNKRKRNNAGFLSPDGRGDWRPFTRQNCFNGNRSIDGRSERCHRLSNECYSLFVFVHHEGVSPTNNAAEQALKKCVIFRKLSFGTESATGSQNLTVILSVLETCRRLKRRGLDFIRDAVSAVFSNKQAPRLLPVT